MKIQPDEIGLSCLYKYRPLNINTLKILSRGELYFSKPRDFNDPFDCVVDKHWLTMFSWANEIINIKDKVKDDNIIKDIDKLTTEFNENIHTSIENIAIKYLNSLYREDISFYNTEQGNVEFNIFLCEQYFRTKQMKETMMKVNVQIKNVNFKNCWNIASHVLAINLPATLFTQRNHFRCVLLKNSTSTPFFTSDQPVINIAADKNNPRKLTINEFEFYYPITPKLALLISLEDNLIGSQNILELGEINVQNYNIKMISQSGGIIFSNSRKGLV
jgi:hypothetical protein